jgi:transposase-like protein
MKLEMTVSEAKEIFKEIQEQPEQLFKMIRADIRQTVGQYLTTMMNYELTQFLGKDLYQRSVVRTGVNHRNGSYRRDFTLKEIGKVSVKVPRDRQGDFKTQAIPQSKQYRDQSRCQHVVFDRSEHPKFVDDSRKVDWPPFVAYRNQQRHRGVERSGGKMAASGFINGIRQIYICGRGEFPHACPKEEFPHAKVQRCQVHVARNVLAKIPQKQKREVAGDIRSIFYASSKKKSLEYFEAFQGKWKDTLPSATSCLERSIHSCLTFFNFPEEEWISLRTTNAIERLNKGFRRRTRPMEILAGEAACYRILAFIAIKMELHWRSNPVGKVRKNLPFFEELNYENFTQKVDSTNHLIFYFRKAIGSTIIT